MLACHASRDVNFPCYVAWRERRRLGLVCSPVLPRGSRRQSRLPLHVGRLHGRPCFGRNVTNLVIELGSFVERPTAVFGVAGLLGEPRERGRLHEKIALGRETFLRYGLCKKKN